MNVSIIIPVYNVSPYIEDCLWSVMRQTYKGSMECLIVDDCGTDDSIAIVEQMIAEYDGPIQFKILRHDHNRGLSAARNTGTMQATGDYLYYLDSDDEITNDCIEKMMEVVKRYPEVEMAQGNVCRCLKHGLPSNIIKNVYQPVTVTNDDARKCFYHYKQMPIPAWNKLLKRTFIIDNSLFFKEGIIYEDLLWTFQLLKCLNNASFMIDVTYYHKKRLYSITSGTDIKASALNYDIIYQDILTHLTPKHELEEITFFTNHIIKCNFRKMHEEHEFVDIVRSCSKKSRLYGGNSLCMESAFLCFLVKFKHGWIVWEQLNRLRHPSLLCRDMKRIKSKLFPPSSYPTLN